MVDSSDKDFARESSGGSGAERIKEEFSKTVNSAKQAAQEVKKGATEGKEEAKKAS